MTSPCRGSGRVAWLARMAGVVLPLAVLLLAGLSLGAAPAAAQTPDLSQMNGRSLPAPDAAVGSATVRVMRQTLGNNVVGQAVTLTDGTGATIGTRTTDDGGRAAFEGLRPGTAYTAVAVVDGERLVSEPFTPPVAGGLRVVLIAGLTSAAPAAGGPAAGAPAVEATAGGAAATGGPAGPAPGPAPTPAPAGSITLGTQSRMIVEQADEFVEVFVLLDLVNPSNGPVSLPAPIVFLPPDGALGTAVLEGATSAVLENGRIVVKGPLPSGPTSVQFGYRLPSDTGRADIAQTFPVGGPMSSVIVRRHAGTIVAVGGERQRRDTQLEGRDYVLVSTGAIQPATPLVVTVSGMPSRSRWPLRVALTLAGLVVLAGLVFGRARADDDGAAPDLARS